MRLRILILFFLCSPALVQAAPSRQTQLNGFYLWQYANSAKDVFGKPFKTLDNQNSTLMAYSVSDHSYMVFESPKRKFIEYITSLQITGYPTKMVPFEGLTLGDSREKVDRLLGPPKRSKKEKGTPYTLCFYDPANYSLEFDQHNRLYSIRLWADKELLDARPDANVPDPWVQFREAVLAKNVPAILKMLRPDIEIYKESNTLTAHGRFADFLMHPDKAFIETLIGDKRSVRAALKQSQASEELRLIQGVGVGLVYKFYKGSIVSEIVFFPYNGQNRVYEISFQDKGAKQGVTAK